MDSLTVKDASAVTQTLGVSTVSAKKYAGHFNMAVPDGGASVYRNLDLSVTGQVVKVSGGTLYGGFLFNAADPTPSGSQKRYLKIYDKASAPTGGDTPVMTITLESGVYTPFVLPACGANFVNGISIRATTGIADADTGAPSTNQVQVNLFYA